MIIMKTSIFRSGLRILLLVLGITFASQASARHYYRSASLPEIRSVNIEYVTSAVHNEFGLNTQAPVFIGTLRIPYSPATSVTLRAFDGGNDGDDDTTGGDTTDDNDHHDGDDSTGLGDHGHHGHHGDDSTDVNDDSTNSGHHGDDDSTDVSDDSTNSGHHGDHDSTDVDDSTGHHGGHDGNDTIECDHHGHDDSTDVDDSTEHSLFNGGHQSIVIKSHSNLANINFQFVNNLATSVKISGMSLSSGKNFTIVSGAPTLMHPAIVAAGGKITVKITFNAADRNIHTDQLLVQSNSSQTPSTIMLSGQQIASASVPASLPAGVAITMLPNPMTSSLKTVLIGVEKASVAVYDMNGKLVFSSVLPSGEWIWNGMTSDGSALLSGTYIVQKAA